MILPTILRLTLILQLLSIGQITIAHTFSQQTPEVNSQFHYKNQLRSTKAQLRDVEIKLLNQSIKELETQGQLFDKKLKLKLIQDSENCFRVISKSISSDPIDFESID